MDDRIADQLRSDIENGRNILLRGGIETGGTTLQKAFGKFIPSDERAFLIKDASEIHNGHKRLIRFELRLLQRCLSVITIWDLLKASLRVRFRGIILREICGGNPRSDVENRGNRCRDYRSRVSQE
jgi:Flp pilus assembly CpaF family ATPase